MSRLSSIVARTYEAFNARDFGAYPELLDEHVELVMSGIAVRGLAAVTDFVAVTARARPGLRLESPRVFAEADDVLVTEVRMIDTASDVETTACGLYRIAGGRIVEWRVYVDPVGEELATAALMAVAAEQSALRRVATLVASQHSPEDLFAALAQEVRVLLGVDASEILRYETDGTATMVAGWSDGGIPLPLGERLSLEGENLASEVRRTGVPGRKQDYGDAPGAIAAMSREVGVRSAVATPIVVEGAIWGMIAVASRRAEPLQPDTEARLAEFSRHAAMAVANAKSRSDLAQSRVRIVRAGDEARRRFERDLHDGAQQRLVALGLEVRIAEETAPPELGSLLSRVATGLTDALDDLRELSRGLHPAVLSEDGLGPALRALALRSAVPVALDFGLDGARFDEPVEVAAYYVASEALTNTAKHAHASRAEVTVTHRDGWLELTVRDDGAGGADAANGSGLTGLADRVDAIGGSMRIESSPGAGTAISVKLPARTLTLR